MNVNDVDSPINVTPAIPSPFFMLFLIDILPDSPRNPRRLFYCKYTVDICQYTFGHLKARRDALSERRIARDCRTSGAETRSDPRQNFNLVSTSHNPFIY